MRTGRYEGLAAAGLRVVAVAWLGLAFWMVADLTALRETAHVSDAAPRVMALVQLPLAMAWALVLALSVSSVRNRLFGAVIAWGLSAGGLAAVLVLLVAGPLLLRTGPGKATDLLGFSFLVQLVPFFLARPIVKALRPHSSASKRSIIALASAFALLSCGFNVSAFVWAPTRCSAGESIAMGRLRGLSSAQTAFREASGGRYGTLECLVDPHSCLPDWASGAPVFVDPSYLEPIHCGYRFTFHTEKDADPASGPADLAAWAMTAVPLAPERFPGRGFCVDGTGALLSSPDGDVPAPVGGRCSESLESVF